MKKTQAVETQAKPSATFAARIPADLSARWKTAVSFTIESEPVAIRKLMEAFCDYVEEHGNMPLPLAIVPAAKRAASSPSSPASQASQDCADIASDTLLKPPRTSDKPKPATSSPTAPSR